MVKELGKPVWVVQKQPANHCLKPCGPPINRGLGTARAPTGTVAAPTHPVLFLLVQQLFLLKPGQHCGLGIGANVSNNSFVQSIRSSGAKPMPQALVQFPDCIPDPSQLQWSEGFSLGQRRLTADPVAQAAN